ncbi:hypothetical protein J2749_000159 [Methanobacterium oryzae]
MDYITIIRLIIGLGWIVFGIYYLYYSKNNSEKYKHPKASGIFWLTIGVTYLLLYFYF